MTGRKRFLRVTLCYGTRPQMHTRLRFCLTHSALAGRSSRRSAALGVRAERSALSTARRVPPGSLPGDRLGLSRPSRQPRSCPEQPRSSTANTQQWRSSSATPRARSGARSPRTRKAYPWCTWRRVCDPPEPDFPEEANRRVVDVSAHLLCAPSAAAVRLQAEYAPGAVRRERPCGQGMSVRHLRLGPAAGERAAVCPGHGAPGGAHRGSRGPGTLLDALGPLRLSECSCSSHPAAPDRRWNASISSTCLHRSTYALPRCGYLETIAAGRDAAVVITHLRRPPTGGLLASHAVHYAEERNPRCLVAAGANALLPARSARHRLAALVEEQRGRRLRWPCNLR